LAHNKPLPADGFTNNENDLGECGEEAKRDERETSFNPFQLSIIIVTTTVPADLYWQECVDVTQGSVEQEEPAGTRRPRERKKGYLLQAGWLKGQCEAVGPCECGGQQDVIGAQHKRRFPYQQSAGRLSRMGKLRQERRFHQKKDRE